MSKTNFTKVEEALAEGMRKIEVDKLLTIADANSGKSSPEKKSKIDSIHLRRLVKVDEELKSLEKLGKNPYVRLRIAKEEMEKFLNDPANLTAKDWERLQAIIKQVTSYKSEIERKPLVSSDEDLIKQQQKKQAGKRFNVNEKWIPLR